MLDQIGIEVVEGGAHFVGVFLVDAEDDGLGEAVGLFQEIGEVAGDGFGAGSERDDALEVGRLIFVVGNLAAVAVEVAFARAPAGGIPFGDDAVNAIGGEEAVVDALAQAVGVDRIAEVEVGVAVFVAQRRGRHAELIGGLEVFEDFAPVAVVPGAAAMAFVDDDEVEEVRGEFFVKAGAAFVFGDGLVDGEIHFAALVRPRRLRSCSAHRRKVAKILSLGSSTRMLRSAR